MVVFTTAPVEYDSGVETLESFECDPFGEGRPRAWRKVRLTGDASQNEAQRLRYASFFHGSWKRDPREMERESQARRDDGA